MMGFLATPSVPRFLKVVFVLDYIHNATCCLLSWLGLHKALQPHISDSQHLSQISYTPGSSVSASRISDTLPVLTFRDFASRFREIQLDDVCAVCLSSFKEDDEIRALCNCRHIFHRQCLDKWIDHEQVTCPLCRVSLLLQSERDDTEADNEETKDLTVAS